MKKHEETANPNNRISNFVINLRIHSMQVKAAGDLDHFGFNSISGTHTAGAGFSVTVTAYDIFDTVKDDFIGSFSLTESNGGTVSPSSVTISSNGQVTITVSVSKTGTGVTLIASSGGKSETSDPFNVNPGALDHFVIGVPSSDSWFKFWKCHYYGL